MLPWSDYSVTPSLVLNGVNACFLVRGLGEIADFDMKFAVHSVFYYQYNQELSSPYESRFTQAAPNQTQEWIKPYNLATSPSVSDGIRLRQRFLADDHGSAETRCVPKAVKRTGCTRSLEAAVYHVG